MQLFLAKVKNSGLYHVKFCIVFIISVFLQKCHKKGGAVVRKRRELKVTLPFLIFTLLTDSFPC